VRALIACLLIGWWGASTPPELAIGMLIILLLGLALAYAIIRRGNSQQ
jgi:hypothetical protein